MLQVVNQARINEVADQAALLSVYQREVAKLKSALLEGGSMLVGPDGELISAETAIDDMRRSHESVAASMHAQIEG